MTHPIDTSPEAIAALLDGVTPGPWKYVPNGKKTSITDCDYDRLFIASGTTAPYCDANFIAAARDLVPALAAEIARLTAERDEARAQVAMAYEVAARLCDDTAQEALDESGTCSRTLWTWFHGQSSAIRTLTPADATAALAARDAAMRNEGRRQAAKIAADYCFARTTNSGVLKSPAVFTSHTWQDIRDTILASLEPEGGE